MSSWSKHPRIHFIWIPIVLIAVLGILYSSPGLPKLDWERDNPIRQVPDFSVYKDVNQKKEAFFTFLYPVIEQENRHLLNIRRQLLQLAEQEDWSLSEREWLKRLRALYLNDAEGALKQEDITRLLRRVDIIPPSLVLAQAAIESAWGTSRFARQGNNLFGQWCFEKGCGLVPRQRADGKHHEVARFDSVNESVQAYLRNLNAFRAYKQLRDARLKARKNEQALTGSQLVVGLAQYSEQGDAYLRKVSNVIKQNQLERFDDQQRETLLASR
ncbi:MAG: glucosaminidase domain-containing protein [Oleiphilaceae bacterium]|nr:glucosaminidase domain-containing protein [Oleiphilaceae bacterium]